jgi:acyl dehydratase
VSAERFPVEAGQIMMFARAIGDPNPLYQGGTDPDGDRARMVAPPTFVEAVLHYDPHFPYRPRIGEPWFGSAAEPSSGPEPEPAAAGGQEGGTSMHAETRLEYHGVLRPGEVLTVREGQGSSWEKEGSRGGKLWFSTFVTDFLRGEELVVRSTMVVVSTESKVDQDPAEERAPHASGPTRPSRTVPGPDPALSMGRPAVGDLREMVLVENLSRVQILLYAGASGDFSPQHTDEVWNTRVAGYPSVFAHGMLTMGMTGRVLTDWFGNDALRAFGMRFRRQVWPGDDLIARAEIVSVRERDGVVEAELKVETFNGRGETVAAGSARVEEAAV